MDFLFRIYAATSVFSILLCGAIESTQNTDSLCLVSNSAQFHKERHLYPPQLYDPVLYESILNGTEKNYYFINCLYLDSQSKKSNEPSAHNCSNKPICPLIRENIADALNLTASVPTNERHTTLRRFCSLKKEINSPAATINVIVFGGSVTAGCFARGCTLNDAINTEPFSRGCAWAAYFGQWLGQASRATVRVLNLALGGAAPRRSWRRRPRCSCRRRVCTTSPAQMSCF